jgi:hypothetical protein
MIETVCRTERPRCGAEGAPRCGALSLLQKPLHHRGVHLNSCLAFVYVGLGPVVSRARVLVHEVLDIVAHAIVRGDARWTSQVLDCGAQADARCAAQVIGRGAQAAARGGARRASRALSRGAYADARGAACCFSQELGRGAQVVAAAPRRCRSRRRTTFLMRSGKE